MKTSKKKKPLAPRNIIALILMLSGIGCLIALIAIPERFVGFFSLLGAFFFSASLAISFAPPEFEIKIEKIWRVFILLVLIIGIFICAFYTGRVWPKKSSKYPEKNGRIADFDGSLEKKLGDCPARTVFFDSFNAILDSEWNGNSKCWYSRQQEDTVNKGTGNITQNGYLRFHYQLIPKDEDNPIAYVGLWAAFSYPPPKKYDVSHYNKITLQIRLGQELDYSNTNVYISLQTANVTPWPGMYDYCEYQIPIAALKESILKWSEIECPFDEFNPPSFSQHKDKIKLDPKQAFQIALCVQSNSTQISNGYIDFDNIRFE